MPTRKRRAAVKDRRYAKKLKRNLKERKSDFINTLNDDCLAKIFGYLSIDEKLSVQAVCKRWRGNSQLAWGNVRSLDCTRFNLVRYSLGHRGGLPRILKQCGCFLHKLKIGPFSKGPILPVIGDYCNNLMRLEISLMNAYDHISTKWFPQMKRLKYFKVEGRGLNFSENFFQTLPHENLTELYLIVNILEPHVYLPRVASSALEKLTKLSALTLNGFSLSPNMLMIINQKSSLTYLSLEGCTARRELPRLDHLTNLEHLNLAKFFQVDDDLLTIISEICKSLKYLNLSGYNNVSDKGLTQLQRLSQLEELVLNDISPITDVPLSTMHTLKKLECAGCYNVNDNGIIALIKYSPNLEYLNLTRSNVSSRMLMEATEIITRRTNDITLHICISLDVRRHWNEDDCPSLLVVESDYLEDTSSSYDSDESDRDSDRRSNSDTSEPTDFVDEMDRLYADEIMSEASDNNETDNEGEDDNHAPA